MGMEWILAREPPRNPLSGKPFPFSKIHPHFLETHFHFLEIHFLENGMEMDVGPPSDLSRTA